MSALLTIVAMAAVIYLVLVAGLFAFQRSLLYHPAGAGAPPAAAGVPEMRPVRVTTSDGLDLVGWYAPPPAGQPVVAYFHGNAGTMSMRAFKARELLDAGFGVLFAGYRGFEGNPGQPSEDGLYRDARAALDWLEAQGVPPEMTVLYGESLGTGVAVQMASERDVAAVVLEAPYTAIPDVAAVHYPLVPVQWLALDRFDSLEKIDEVRAPLLVLHGERDRVVPVDFGRRLFKAAPEPKQGVFLPDGTHGNLFDLGAGGIVVDFLAGVVGEAEEAIPAAAE